ncbi:MAG: hypothetical protein AseanaTS_27400 [Candidatus Pelagadaptatus aseana]
MKPLAHLPQHFNNVTGNLAPSYFAAQYDHGLNTYNYNGYYRTQFNGSQTPEIYLTNQ